MMSALFLLVAAAAVNPGAAGIDPHLASGLNVSIDRIAEPLSVDGVQVIVHRVTGAGVPELARRIEETWRRQGSRIGMQQHGNWTVLSRLQGSRSEVMQWSIISGAPELLLSFLDLLAPVSSVPATGLTLPAGCVWGRSIFGRGGRNSYIQRSARCPQSIKALSLQLRHSLAVQGWVVLMDSESGLQVGRSGAEGFISLSSQQGDQSTWLTWLRVESAQ